MDTPLLLLETLTVITEFLSEKTFNEKIERAQLFMKAW